MLIGTRQSIAKMADVRIHINNEPLKHVSVAKYLGMSIDSNLKWDDHINSMIPKMSSKIGILRSLYQIVSIDILRQLYNAIVQPHFDYGDVIYDSATAPTKTRLQKLRPELLLISGSSPRQNRNTRFQTGWLSLQQRRHFNKCVLMYKCVNGLAPQYLCDMVTSNSHSYNTRNASQLKPSKAKTAYYQQFQCVRFEIMEKKLRIEIQNIHSVQSFKKTLHKYLSVTPPY